MFQACQGGISYSLTVLYPNVLMSSGVEASITISAGFRPMNCVLRRVNSVEMYVIILYFNFLKARLSLTNTDLLTNLLTLLD